MKFIYLFSFIFIAISSCGNITKEEAKAETQETETIYYLIRHSEKDRSDKTNTNPGLKVEGKQRAQNWATYFEAIALDEIYATNYNRTQQTAAPTAASKNITVKTYDPTMAFANTLINESKGKMVLVVGHSNTTPMIANALLQQQKFKDINDTINSLVFRISVIGNQRTVKVDTIN